MRIPLICSAREQTVRAAGAVDSVQCHMRVNWRAFYVDKLTESLRSRPKSWQNGVGALVSCLLSALETNIVTFKVVKVKRKLPICKSPSQKTINKCASFKNSPASGLNNILVRDACLHQIKIHLCGRADKKQCAA